MRNVFLSLIVLVFGLVGFSSCGGGVATSSGSGGSSSGSGSGVDEVEDITVNELISGGIQVEPEEQLKGTWKVISYSLGSSDSIIESDEDDPEITFPESSNSLNYLTKGSGILTDYSVPPLYDYEVGEKSYFGQGFYWGEGEPRKNGGFVLFYCNDANIHSRCSCGNTDMVCSVPMDSDGSICESQVSSLSLPCSKNVKYWQYVESTDGEKTVKSLVDAKMSYKITATEIDDLITFTLEGDSYGMCGDKTPNGCSDWDPTPVKEIKETSYVIRSTRSGLLGIETPKSYIILKKKK